MSPEVKIEQTWIKRQLLRSFAYASFLAVLVIFSGGLSDAALRFVGMALGGAIMLSLGINVLFVVITYSILVFYSNIFQLGIINAYYSDTVLDNATTQIANGVMTIGVGAGVFFGFSSLNFKLPLIGKGLIIMLALILSILVTGAEERGWVEVTRFFQFLIFFLMLASFIRSREKILTVLFYTMGAFFVLLVLILIQFLTEPVKFAAVGKFLVFIPILQALAEYAKKKEMKGLYKLFLALAVVGTLMLLMGESRRLIFSLLLVWTFYLFQIGFNKKILAMLTVSFMIIYALLPENFFARTTETVDYYSSSLGDEGSGLDQTPTAKSVTSSRNILWGIGWEVFLSSPVFGVGPGMSDLVVGSSVIGSEYEAMRIHNLYLEILADTGIIGFIMVLSYFIAIWMLIRKGLKLSAKLDDPLPRLLFLAYRVVFISTLVVNFYGNAGVFGKYEWFFNALMAGTYMVVQFQVKENARLEQASS